MDRGRPAWREATLARALESRVLRALFWGFVVLFCVCLAFFTVVVAQYLYRSMYTDPATLTSLDAFRQQYESGIYAYRFLFRELVLWQVEYRGIGLYEARALVNVTFLVVLYLACLGLALHYRLRGDAALVLLFLVALVVVFCLYVGGDPYTIPSNAVAYASLLPVLAWPRSALAYGVSLLLLLTAILGHEAALLMAAGIAGAVLRDVRDDRQVIPRLLALAAVAVAGYVGPRLAIDSDALTHGDVTLWRNLGETRAWLIVGVVLVALAALLSCARPVLTQRAFLPLTLLLATLLAYGPYVAVVGLLIEARMFLIYFPAALLLFVAANRPAAAPG